MRRAAPAALLASLASLAACDKFEFLPDDPVAPITPLVLMHRGGGSTPPPGIHENTLAAVRHGMSLLDGAEVDVQISADGTLWLGHDNEVYDCDHAVVGCFQDLTDEEIRTGAATCPDGVHYNTLEEVFAGVTDYPRKPISLDIKGQYCGAGVYERGREMAREVDRLVRAHGRDWTILAETSQLSFLDELWSRGAPVYSLVVALDDIDGALTAAASSGAAGISFKYYNGVEPLTASAVAGIHQKGFRIAVWTINGRDPAREVWVMQPDVIQTDDPDFMSYVADLALPFPPP